MNNTQHVKYNAWGLNVWTLTHCLGIEAVGNLATGKTPVTCNVSCGQTFFIRIWIPEHSRVLLTVAERNQKGRDLSKSVRMK